VERHRAICLNGVTPADVTYRSFAAALGADAELRLKDLEGYAAEFPIGYSLETEVLGIARVARDAKWARFHLVGYSGGASAALAFAAARPQAVVSLSLIEPVFVGNDASWSDAYAALLASVDDALRAPLEKRPAAFFRALSAPGRLPPAQPAAGQPDWLIPRSERQGWMWPRWRDGSLGPNRLEPFHRSVYVAVGGRSRVAFMEIARWLARQSANTIVDVYDERSHFDPPHVADAERFATAVQKNWERAVAAW
jgi:pimeloyl-ACP methyl ester carboxylesterase